MYAKLIRLVATGTLFALLSACAGNGSYVALLPSPDGTTGKVIVTGKAGEQVIDKAGNGAPLDGSQPAQPVSEKTLQQDFSAAMAARPRLPEHFLLYFESGGTALTPESIALLPKIIADASMRPGVDMSIIGHTDTAGAEKANEDLALQRAEAVARMLRAMGLDVKTLSVESHGERNLLVPTPDDTPEPRNRRVEIAVR